MCSCGNPSCNNCSQCQVSILNNQSSIIASPICTPICPTIQGCTDIVYTNCIQYTGPNLSCIGVFNGYNLNAVIASINTTICNTQPPSGWCNVYASCTDPCPSGLVNKITSSTLNVNLSTNGITSCQTVQIEDKPWVFYNSILNTGFITPTGSNFSPLRFGVKCGYPTTGSPNCNTTITTSYLEVRFHGQVQVNSTFTIAPQVVFTLPLQYRPPTTKYYSGYTNLNPSSVGPYFIVIYPNGNITLQTAIINESNCIIPFDGINYIIN